MFDTGWRSGRLHRVLGAGMALAAALSCGGSDDVQIKDYRDEGPLCLRSLADGALQAAVFVPQCLSSSCDEVTQKSCSLTVEGTRLVVRSRLVVQSEGGICTTDCGIEHVVCSTADVTAGNHLVVHGEQSMSVMLPTDAAAVFGDPNCDFAFE